MRSHGTMPLDWPLVPRISAPRAADPRARDADAAGELRQLGDLGVAVVDRVEVVPRGVDQVAGGHLRVPGAGVEQRRRAGQVGQRGHQPVEARSPRPACGTARRPRAAASTAGSRPPAGWWGGAAGSGRRPCAGRSTRTGGRASASMASSSLRALALTNARRLVADQALGVPERDRLAERGDALAADLLVDVRRQQPRGEPRVLRLLADHLRRGLDREPVQLGGRGAVVQAADRPGRDAQRVDVGEVVAPSARRRGRSC